MSFTNVVRTSNSIPKTFLEFSKDRGIDIKLLDFELSANNGNWQWISGSGADSQPYFRVFNPWLQSKKHDPKGTYIKKWLPELKDVEPKHLHEWDKYCEEYKGKLDYPSPIVDYKEAKERVLKAYKKALY